jgi:hypothetical protein
MSFREVLIKNCHGEGTQNTQKFSIPSTAPGTWLRPHERGCPVPPNNYLQGYLILNVTLVLKT